MKRFQILFCLMSFSTLIYAQANIVTVISEDFEGRLYVYDDRDEAERALRTNLSEKMERRLKKMGFSEDYIFTLLKRAVFSKITVVEKRVEILKDNRKIKTTAFDISGQISISLDENDIRELAQDLKRFSPVSEEERTVYIDSLKFFLQVSSGIKDIDIESLRLKLSEIYKTDIKKRTRLVFETDNTSFSSLKDRVVDVLSTIDNSKSYLGGESDIAEVVEDLVSKIKSYFKRSIIDVSNYQEAISCSEAIAELMPYKKEETLKSLLFIIEFKWAENIQNITQSSNVEIKRLYSELYEFINRFKGSKILKNIRLKMENRLKEELSNTDIDYYIFQYAVFISDLLGLKDKELMSLVLNNCEIVLKDVESSSDEQSKGVLKTFEICAKFSPPDRKKKILAYKDRFQKTDKNRIYKNSLGGLSFVMKFVKYLPEIPFGKKKGQLTSQRFADFLNEGQTTSKCSCSVEPDDECVIFNYAGEQYEFVSRYNSMVLYEVAICDMNLSGRGAVLMSFLRDALKPITKLDLHSFENKDGIFDFEVERGVILSIEKIGSRANMYVYDRTIKVKKDNKPKGVEKDEKVNSFRKGDCVEWDCDIECRYRGKVEKIIEDELIVIITSATKASELNMRRKVKRSAVQQCSLP